MGSFFIGKKRLVRRRKGITFLKSLSVADPALTAFHVPLYSPFLFKELENGARRHGLIWLKSLFQFITRWPDCHLIIQRESLQT